MTVNVAPIINHKKQAIAACHLANKAVGEALRHAIDCGQHLMVVKADLPHGEFLLWCENNMPVKYRQCRKYMYIAENHELLKVHRGAYLENTSISEADRLIHKKLKPKPPLENITNTNRSAHLDGTPTSEPDPIRTAVIQALPQGTDQRIEKTLVNVVKKLWDELLDNFNAQVNQAAAEKVREAKAKAISLEDKAEAELKEISKMRSNVTCFISQEEYKLIRACLHPDKYPDADAGQKRRLKKAYKAFTKLSEVNDMLNKWSIK